MCRRLAITPDQGQGWSEYTGAQWIQPRINGGAVLVSDSNDIQRLVFDCASPNNPGIFESGTYDQLQFNGPAYVDKQGIATEDGGNAEITWSKWCGEIVADSRRQNDTLELMESHVFVRPQVALNDGRTGYDENGMRDGFELSIDDYTEGDQRTPIGIATDVPVDGDIVFSGVKVEGRRHQFVVTGNRSEMKVSGISHAFVSKPRPATVENRATGDTNAQSILMSGLITWITRGKTLGYDRVSKGTYVPTSGVLTKTTGVDGRQTAFVVPSGSYLRCVPRYPQSWFIMTCADGTPNPEGVASCIQYGEAFNGWVIMYGQKAGGGGYLDLNPSIYWDFRALTTDPVNVVAEYYNNIRYSGGDGFIPSA
jgi:hypothetical protein